MTSIWSGLSPNVLSVPCPSSGVMGRGGPFPGGVGVGVHGGGAPELPTAWFLFGVSVGSVGILSRPCVSLSWSLACLPVSCGLWLRLRGDGDGGRFATLRCELFCLSLARLRFSSDPPSENTLNAFVMIVRIVLGPRVDTEGPWVLLMVSRD
jgi:hypothetical protein